MNRSKLEQYLGKTVKIVLFDGDTFSGELHKTGEEQFKNDLSLCVPRKYYFLTSTGNKTCSCLFRCSHVVKITEE